MKIRPMEAELYHANRRTDGHEYQLNASSDT